MCTHHRSWRRLLPVGLAISCTVREETPPTQEVAMVTTAEIATSSRGREPDGSVEPRMQAHMVGSGPPLVLVGGGLTGWASWQPHAERLANTRTVVRLQPLNVQFGLDDRPLPKGYSVEHESRALAGALDALGRTEPLDLVGWSYGALITLGFALDHPDRVRSLVLIEPPARWVLSDRARRDPEIESLYALAESISEDVTARDLEALLQSVALVPPGTSPRELPQWPVWYEHRRSLRGGIALIAPLNHRDDPARLRAFARPVLLVTGTGTSPFLRRIHDTLAELLPRARAIELPGGHAAQHVSMDRFLDEVARFQADSR